MSWNEEKNSSACTGLLGAYIYVYHLSTVTEDMSLKPDDRQRLKGYLHRWRQPIFLETQNWQKSFSEDSINDGDKVLDLTEVRTAMEYIISEFH